MPTAASGMTGNEIVSRVKNWFGNTDSAFQTYLEETLPLAEFDFCKRYDWDFLKRTNLSLTVSSGTEEYTLDSGTIGHYMAAEDVDVIYNETEGILLKKTTLETIRRFDTQKDDGTSTSNITHWAPSGDNKIIVYPGNAFEDTTLKVAGKITPVSLYTLTNYPTVPPRYQASLIALVIGMAAERENDPRAPQLMQKAEFMIQQDIRTDQSGQHGNDEPRIKHWKEAITDGIGGDLEPQWIKSLFRS